MHWFLTIFVILAKPVTDGGSEKPGDLLKYLPMGATQTEAQCEEIAADFTGALRATGQDSVIVLHNCTPIPVATSDAIGDAQGWTPPDEGGWPAKETD
ncbi:hypothetical protein [Defluviimonas salinarum]|uniref:Uncharacterized protein n=1 Tax=Defluviimonas salinarum TaxID=2992147 RepID=A0ABT3J5S3_9RHOB|nr:hypothetical protein [Defluviimonas salinarum]MCW3783011.1 hypothetical protein [Defluviimonas salinarum]